MKRVGFLLVICSSLLTSTAFSSQGLRRAPQKVNCFQKQQANRDLWRAVNDYNDKRVEEALKAGANPNVRSIKYFRTPLHKAAITNDPKIAELLLTYGAKIDALNIFKNSALHVAASHGNFAVVQKLLEKGADPTLKNLLKETPADRADKNGYYSTVNLLNNFLNDRNREPKNQNEDEVYLNIDEVYLKIKEAQDFIDKVYLIKEAEDLIKEILENQVDEEDFSDSEEDSSDSDDL